MTGDNINEFILRENEIKQRRVDMLNALTHHEKVIAPLPVLPASNICENYDVVPSLADRSPKTNDDTT